MHSFAQREFSFVLDTVTSVYVEYKVIIEALTTMIE